MRFRFFLSDKKSTRSLVYFFRNPQALSRLILKENQESKRPFPSSKILTLKTRLSANLSCENEFYLHENKNHFHIDGFTISLALKQSLGQLENCLLRWRGTTEGVSKGIVLGVGREGGHNHPRSPPLTDYCLMSHANTKAIKDILRDTFIMKRSKDYITLHS